MILNEILESSETLLTQRNVLSIDVSPYELSNLMKEFRAADPTYNKIGDAAMVTFYTPEERKDFEQFLKSKQVKYNSIGELSESRISVFEATRDELIANVEQRRKQQFIDKVLNFLHSAVSQDPNRQSVGGHAFDIARQIDLDKIGLDAKSLEKLYRERFGITEGYQLQLERDPAADLLVLHVKDTKTGRRSEVRGKPGYETNGYDPNDRLHQLLDQIGKAANVSDLINGETVSINPKHPQGTGAKQAAQQITTEALNQPYNWKWAQKDNDEWVATTKTDNGRLLEVLFYQHESGVWDISFYVDDTMDKTGGGDQFRIFATVSEITKDWVNKVGKNAEIIEFSAYKGTGEGASRTKLYKRLASLLAKQLGFRIKTVPAGRNIDIYQLHNPVYESLKEDDASTTNQISDEQKEKILSSLYVNAGIKLPARYTLWRGVGNSGMGMATYGTGLYTTTNRKHASQFGKVVKMDSEALPDFPLRFDTINDYEIWLGQSIRILGYNDARDFAKDYNDIRFFVQSLGYDGVQIGKGRDAMFVQYPI